MEDAAAFQVAGASCRAPPPPAQTARSWAPGFADVVAFQRGISQTWKVKFIKHLGYWPQNRRPAGQLCRRPFLESGDEFPAAATRWKRGSLPPPGVVRTPEKGSVTQEIQTLYTRNPGKKSRTREQRTTLALKRCVRTDAFTDSRVTFQPLKDSADSSGSRATTPRAWSFRRDASDRAAMETRRTQQAARRGRLTMRQASLRLRVWPGAPLGQQSGCALAAIPETDSSRPHNETRTGGKHDVSPTPGRGERPAQPAPTQPGTRTGPRRLPSLRVQRDGGFAIPSSR